MVDVVISFIDLRPDRTLFLRIGDGVGVSARLDVRCGLMGLLRSAFLRIIRGWAQIGRFHGGGVLLLHGHLVCRRARWRRRNGRRPGGALLEGKRLEIDKAELLLVARFRLLTRRFARRWIDIPLRLSVLRIFLLIRVRWLLCILRSLLCRSSFYLSLRNGRLLGREGHSGLSKRMLLRGLLIVLLLIGRRGRPLDCISLLRLRRILLLLLGSHGWLPLILLGACLWLSGTRSGSAAR